MFFLLSCFKNNICPETAKSHVLTFLAKIVFMERVQIRIELFPQFVFKLNTQLELVFGPILFLEEFFWKN